jgi:hypothetical protein
MFITITVSNLPLVSIRLPELASQLQPDGTFAEYSSPSMALPVQATAPVPDLAVVLLPAAVVVAFVAALVAAFEAAVVAAALVAVVVPVMVFGRVRNQAAPPTRTTAIATIAIASGALDFFFGATGGPPAGLHAAAGGPYGLWPGCAPYGCGDANPLGCGARGC